MIAKLALGFRSSESGAGTRLRALCGKVLRARPERDDQSLLEIGLNSLSAASLAWLIEKEFHVCLPLSLILDQPTIENLLGRIEAGSCHQTGSTLVTRSQHPKPVPLSFAQEQVWFLEKLHPRLNSYRFQALLNCRGALDPNALEKSLNLMVSRHQILRTAFVAQEGEAPRQEIRPHVPFALPHEDLRVLPEKSREVELQRRINEELQRPFHHGTPPLVRWRLYQLDEQRYSLLHTEHHFVHDGWSYGVFLEELYAAYSAFRKGDSLETQSPPAQFADFALWQRQMMDSGAWNHQLEYWRRELAGSPPPPQLPSDRRLGHDRSFEGLQIRHPIPEALWAELGNACAREGVTCFAWIQAVFHLLIHLYTGAEDFCTGTGFANRRDPRFHRMLGMAINTLPVRARLKGSVTFRDLLRKTRDTLRFALDNQELPFQTIVKDLNPGRDADRNPFFNAFVAAYDTAYPAFADESLEITSEDGISCGQVKFDLVALLIPGRHAQAGHSSTVPLLLWEFSSELFDDSTGRTMLDRFINLLEHSIRQPGAPIGHLSVASDGQTIRLLGFGQGRDVPPQCKTPLHRLFESVAAAASEAPAIVAAETSLSYGELNIRANKLARRLQAQGFAAGSVGAVALPRGPEAIVSFLAILKAGGAYLPVDLRDPADRISNLLRSAGARIVLTASGLAPSLPAFVAKGEKCFVDEPFEAAESNLPNGGSRSSPAYVLFTSGSTGVPKAVVVPHRAVSRLVFGLPVVHLDRSETLLHLAPLSFDASTFEIWGALLHGAKLVISSEDLPDFQSLGVTIRTHGVTTIWLTSSLFNRIIDTSPEILLGLRQILTGGEALSPNHIRRALELLPGTRIINGYGPTETTTFATLYHVPKDFDEVSRAVPIGRPLAGTRLYVVSEWHRQASAEAPAERFEDARSASSPPLAPIGVPGELYIGGHGVALGYMNLPELTGEHFVPDPFAKESEGRLYKTGDLVRWRPDGNLDFLGRLDDQVKIRGFRIEPGEIEAALERHPTVNRAVVKMTETAPGEKRLVAYYEARKGNPSEPAEVLKLLSGQLPRYMIPAALIKVEKLPLTATGKIDRLALPKPRLPASENLGSVELTPTEQIVSNVWGNALHADVLDPQKSFFDLGGDSLLAIQAVAVLRKILHIELPITALLDNPTVASLSRHLDQLVERNLETVRPPIEKVSRDQPLPLSFAQERLWRNERHATSPDNVNVIVLDLKGELNIPCLERSFQELIQRHEVFRTTFHVLGDFPVQRIAACAPSKLTVLDLSQTPDAEERAARYAREEKLASISLERGPLLRFSLLRFGPRHHRLLMKLHHILYDTWSLPIFHRELDALYQAFCLGRDSPLPELTVQLADFAVWQRRYLGPDSSAFRAQLAYWRKQLSGKLPILKLPCERPSELESARIEDVLVSFEISEQLSATLRTLTKREGTTLFITFLTALKALINISTDQTDILLGVYMAKRNALESERMMGYFCDLGILRTRISSHLSFLELLCRVRETVLNAHAYEDMPFDVLGEELRKCGQTPPDLRAIFMFESFLEQPFHLGGLEVNQLKVADRRTMPWRFHLHVRDEGKSFGGWAIFDARLHDPHLVRIMMRNYVKLLEAVAREPASPVCAAAARAGLEERVPLEPSVG